MSFWQRPIHTLNQHEWEQLCDHCGRCCMHKFEDEDNGAILHTRIACHLFDTEQCTCSDYAHRLLRVPECLNIRTFQAKHFAWLPETCAYRLRFEGKPLPSWHPLISGDEESVHQAGISMRGRAINEQTLDESEWLEFTLHERDAL